jgi:hypothetical protein
MPNKPIPRPSGELMPDSVDAFMGYPSGYEFAEVGRDLDVGDAKEQDVSTNMPSPEPVKVLDDDGKRGDIPVE